jgi:hypothetical protein
LHIADFKRGGGEILMTLQNSGKAVAKDVSVSYSSYLVLPSDPERQEPPFKSEAPIEYGSLAPNKAGTRSLIFELPSDKDLPVWANLLIVVFKVTYTDEARGNAYSEPETFCGVLSGREIITPEMLPGPLPSVDVLERAVPTAKKQHK